MPIVRYGSRSTRGGTQTVTTAARFDAQAASNTARTPAPSFATRPIR